MTVPDLVLVLAVLATGVTLLRLVYLLVRARWNSASRAALLLGLGVLAYGGTLAVVSMLSPQQIMHPHQDRCFDDWCLAVDRVAHPPSIGAARPRGKFYVVTIQISSRALRASQRALDAQVYLMDAHGHRFDAAPAAQHVLEGSGAAGQPLDTELPPGGSFTHTVAFDLPVRAQRVGLVVTHGLFPDLFVIGDAQSFLHKPTIILL